MSSRRLAAAALTVLAMSVTTACGGSDDGSDASGAPSPAASQERLADQGPAPVGDRTGPAGQLTVANDPNLGPIITDASGFTLYRFTKDGPNPELSACDAACAKLWPPVPADGALAPAGVDDALLGAVTRGDGSRQLMFDGLPLYRYAKDAKPGQVAGEGVGKTWFASLPSDTVSSVQPGVDASGPSEEAPEGEAPPQEGEVGEEVLEALPGLSVVDDPELGEIVVDAKGRTLYRFVKDTDWPMTTACTGSCLDTWKRPRSWRRTTSRASTRNWSFPSIGLTGRSSRHSTAGRCTGSRAISSPVTSTVRARTASGSPSPPTAPWSRSSRCGGEEGFASGGGDDVTRDVPGINGRIRHRHQPLLGRAGHPHPNTTPPAPALPHMSHNTLDPGSARHALHEPNQRPRVAPGACGGGGLLDVLAGFVGFVNGVERVRTARLNKLWWDSKFTKDAPSVKRGPSAPASDRAPCSAAFCLSCLFRASAFCISSSCFRRPRL